MPRGTDSGVSGEGIVNKKRERKQPLSFAGLGGHLALRGGQIPPCWTLRSLELAPAHCWEGPWAASPTHGGIPMPHCNPSNSVWGLCACEGDSLSWNGSCICALVISISPPQLCPALQRRSCHQHSSMHLFAIYPLLLASAFLSVKWEQSQFCLALTTYVKSKWTAVCAGHIRQFCSVVSYLVHSWLSISILGVPGRCKDDLWHCCYRLRAEPLPSPRQKREIMEVREIRPSWGRCLPLSSWEPHLTPGWRIQNCDWWATLSH